MDLPKFVITSIDVRPERSDDLPTTNAGGEEWVCFDALIQGRSEDEDAVVLTDVHVDGTTPPSW
jgi:hypothetical protein